MSIRTCAVCDAELKRREVKSACPVSPNTTRLRTETSKQFSIRMCCSSKCGAEHRSETRRRKAMGVQVDPIRPVWASTPGPRNYAGMWR